MESLSDSAFEVSGAVSGTVPVAPVGSLISREAPDSMLGTMEVAGRVKMVDSAIAGVLEVTRFY
jgi:hypothetical protein